MTSAPTFDAIILDYGHGGVINGIYQTPGGKQYHHTDVDPVLSLYEGVSNRQTAARLIPMLLAAGVLVFDCVAERQWTAPPANWLALAQMDTPLQRRTAYANSVATGYRCRRALYLSLHSNATGNTIRGPSQPARGVDIYTSRGQTLADGVASSIHASMAKTLPAAGMPVRRGEWSDGDVDHEAGFWVLRKTAMPAVLTETGFFTNLQDARFLSSEAGQDAIAMAIYGGLRDWLGRRRMS